MAEDSRVGPIAPLSDTRALDESQLLESQRAALDELLRRLEGFVRASRPCPAKPTGCETFPWTALDPNRNNQVLMIDGGRGTGKTSVLMTALDRWRSEGAPWSVMALEPVDFDPMPKGMSPYSWVVLSIRRLIDWIEARDPSHPGAKWMAADQRGTHQLDEKWRLFFRRAEMGWSTPTKQSDIEDFVETREEKQRGWQKLVEAWRDLVDALVQRLEHCGQLRPGGVIVQPIDDLDLAPRSARALLLALRQLVHPRVVFVIAGDISHLQRVVELQQFESERLSGVSEAVRDTTWERTRLLARDLVNKVIPLGHRMPMRPLGPWAAIELMARWAGQVVEDADGKPLVQVEAYLADSLSEGGTDSKVVERHRRLAERILTRFQQVDRAERLEVGFRIRDLVQVNADCPYELDRVERVNQLLRKARLSDGSDAFDENLLTTSRLWIRPGSRIHHHEYFLANDFKIWPGETGDPLNVVMETVLQIPQLRPRAPVWMLGKLTSPLVGSVLQISVSQVAYLQWPGVDHLGLDEAYDSAANLEEVFARTSDLFLAWLICNLRWVGESAPGTLTLEAVLKRIIVATKKNSWLVTWATEQLPVLCAPEYGIPAETCRALLRTARSLCRRGNWRSLSAGWQRQREEWLQEALSSEAAADVIALTLDSQEFDHPWHSAIGPNSWFEFGKASGQQGKDMVTRLSQMTLAQIGKLVGRRIAQPIHTFFQREDWQLDSPEGLLTLKGVGPTTVEKLTSWLSSNPA